MKKRETKEDLRRQLREMGERAIRAEGERDAYRHALGMTSKATWVPVLPEQPRPIERTPIDLTPKPIWVAPDPLRDGGPIWIDPNYLPPSWWLEPPKVEWPPYTTSTTVEA